MKFNLTHYIIAAASLVIVLLAFSLWSNHKLASLEREVENAKAFAAEKQTATDEKERRAAEYKAKNEYLEQKIAEIRGVAAKQDEELEKLS